MQESLACAVGVEDHRADLQRTGGIHQSRCLVSQLMRQDARSPQQNGSLARKRLNGTVGIKLDIQVQSRDVEGAAQP